MATDTLVSQAV
ncbi:hypothetical protein F383_34248 [Gossypium arboreum]|uniref:Uncharacterized protein n=1 Tax=Gossypium arboreum TaxID=29729 RepID=A0A0B0N456_GOSAR|nr:hypothetical protein F383_34248 [Gossypium arboreum]